MDARTTGIVAYITWIGLLIALIAGDTEGAKFHLNQSLVICIASLFSFVFRSIPILGGALAILYGVAILICFVIGVVGAINGEEREVPILGSIKLLK